MTSESKIISPEVIAEAQELLKLAMETPREVADVFVEYSAHVHCLHVSVYLGGWREGAAKDVDGGEYLDTEGAFARIQALHAKAKSTVAAWQESPKPLRDTQRAKSLRASAERLMAEADALTQAP